MMALTDDYNSMISGMVSEISFAMPTEDNYRVHLKSTMLALATSLYNDGIITFLPQEMKTGIIERTLSVFADTMHVEAKELITEILGLFDEPEELDIESDSDVTDENVIDEDE